jgi:hypothetical protein
MITRNNRIISLCALAALTFFSSAALAQTPSSDSSHAAARSAEELARASLHYRIIAVVNAVTLRVNTEGAEFNKRLSQMNSAAPLESSHIDSAGLAKNIPLILEFLQYLKASRLSSDSLDQAFNDSMFALNADLPANDVDEGLKDIGDSFNKDRKAFGNFLAALDKLYSKVLDALLFLQNTHYTIANDQLSFVTQKDATEYSKLLGYVDAANAELNKANEALRKANAEANKKAKLKKPDSSQ